MSNHQEISSFIWRVCDDELRGLFKSHEYGDIILPFVVLRRLDCLIELHKDEVVKQYNELLQSGIDDPTPIIKKKTGLNFFNYSPYDLTRLKSDPNGLKINFPNYLNGYSDNVHQILENFQLDKPVEKLIKNKKLYSLIDKFTEVDLHPNKVDNHTMGSIFEELLRKFSEMSNETSGEHYTPRDVVKLLVSMVFSGDDENLKGEGVIRSIFDPCCGTGGMLTIGKEWVNDNISPDVMFQLYGQELNPQTHSICKSDFLITGEDPERIKLGSSLSNDQHEGRKFDYMITNPPFGVSWKSEKNFIEEESKNSMGRFSVGTPRTSDGSLLFLQHMISKMKPEGSRIGVVFSGSPLFSGDSGSGESEIRRWIIENDWLESIVSLPDSIFFNTDISSYLWILSNKKEEKRMGNVQLIDGTNFYKKRRRNLGDKNKDISSEDRNRISELYINYENNDYSRILSNNSFGHIKLTIERPQIENGEPVKKRDGSFKPDSSKREYLRVPLDCDVNRYFEEEIKPHYPNSWLDRSKDKIGFEINFNKTFFKHKPLRTLEEITKDLLLLEEQSDGLLKEVLNEIG